MREDVKSKPMTAEQLRYFSYQTCQWWNVVFVQAKRFFKMCEIDEGNWPWNEPEGNALLTADRLFLIIAIYHAIENVQKLDMEMQRKNDNSFQAVLQAIESVAPFKDIRDLRNMNEHSLDYQINMGNKQREYCKTIDEESIRIRTNAAWTFIDSEANVFLLGNVRIDKLLSTMKEQQPIVRDKTKEIFYNSFREE